MKRSILKSLLIVAITSGCICSLVALADSVAKDGTRFYTNSSGNTVIDHRGRDGSDGSVIVIDRETGRRVTTSN